MEGHPLRDGPPPRQRHAAPTGHASRRDSAGPPHPHTRAHSTWVADPDSPPRGRAAGGGTAPEFRRPSQRAPPPGTPSRHPHSAQRPLARAHAVGPVLGPHAHDNGTRETRAAEPWLPAPGDGRPGGGQRLTPDAPHNNGRPPPQGCRPQGPQCRVPTPAPTAPGNHGQGRGTLAARLKGRAAGGGTAPDTRCPSHRWTATLPGTAPHHPRNTQPPTGHASQGDSAGPPHPHTRAHSTRPADPDSSPRGRAAGGRESA